MSAALTPVSAALAAQAPHFEQFKFSDFPSFQAFIQATHKQWPQQVQQALRLMALHGIQDPVSQQPVAPAALRVSGSNYRETLEVDGCLARHRAVLLVLQQLIDAGLVPAAADLQIYCPEIITQFSERLRQLFPQLVGSEYIPDSSDPLRANILHQDLCQLTFGPAVFDVVICNELFEHLYDLPAALAEIARVLRPGGYLVSTFPFAYGCFDTIVKTRHRPGAAPGVAAEAELLTEAEFHGNPVAPEQGSLVYQIPAWDLLDQALAAGLNDPVIHWIAAPSYGVVGNEIPAVMVLLAGKA